MSSSFENDTYRADPVTVTPVKLNLQLNRLRAVWMQHKSSIAIHNVFISAIFRTNSFLHHQP